MRGLCEESVSLKDESRGRAVAALVCAPDMGAAHQDLFLFAHGGGLYPEDYENPPLFYDQLMR